MGQQVIPEISAQWGNHLVLEHAGKIAILFFPFARDLCPSFRQMQAGGDDKFQAAIAPGVEDTAQAPVLLMAGQQALVEKGAPYCGDHGWQWNAGSSVRVTLLHSGSPEMKKPARRRAVMSREIKGSGCYSFRRAW